MYEKIIKKLLSQETKCIYGTMYGGEFIRHCGVDGEYNYRDKLIKIDKNKLHIGKDSMTYVWGWPGPDFNVYKFSDYGKTWAFSREEMQEYEYYEELEE